MLRALGLTAALIACIALPAPTPALAQTHPAATAAPTGRGTEAATAPAAAGKRIDVNSASEQDLAALPGIGPVTAKNIVQGRPWDDLKSLVSKKAMTQPTFQANKDRLALANINSTTAANMALTLPGIGDALAPKIVAGRPYAAPQDLVTKKILTQKQFDKIKDLVTY